MTAAIDTAREQGGAAAAPTRERPAWLQQQIDAYMSGVAHGYIVDGDIEGLAYENASQRQLLLAYLGGAGAVGANREVVAYWHLASGGVVLYDDQTEWVGADGTSLGTRRQIATNIIQPAGAAFAAAPAGGSSAAALLAQAGPPAGGADPFAQAQQPLQALALLQKLLTEGRSKATGKGNVAVVIDYSDTLCPAPAMAGKGAMSGEDRRILVTLLSWAKDRRIDSLGNMIFLLCRDRQELHPDLRATDSGWRAITIAPPDREARRDWLAWFMAIRQRKRKPIALRDGLTLDEVAGLTAGLNLRNLEDIMLTAYRQGGLTRAALKSNKDRIISQEYSAVAEMIEPLPGGFKDVGGLDVLKSYCERRIIRPIRQGRTANVPRGIMLVGPPGTGKTFGVRALAGEIGFTAVALNSAKILGGIVGESERNMATFLGFCRALAPVVVFVDEFDQSDMSQRGDQSGNPVAKNLFSTLLQFMSDETLRGKVIVIMASNRPDKIDPAMKRSGRIDAIIPLLLPGHDDRIGIAAAQARAQGIAIADDALAAIGEGTDNWNAGDLAEIIREARLTAEDEGREVITLADARDALDDLMPSGLDTVEQFKLLAVAAVNKRRLLPPEYANLRAEPGAVERRIEETRPALWDGGARSERD